MARGRDNSRSRSGRSPRSVFDAPHTPGKSSSRFSKDRYGEKASNGTDRYSARAEEPPYGPEWKFTCELVKRRDNYTCTNPRCRVRYAPPMHGKLDCHHIIRREKGGPDTPDNLRTLCKPCHALEHPHLQRMGYGKSKRKKL